MTLKDLKIGQTAVIAAVGGEGALRQHFLDMGVIPGIEITLIKYAPMGDPMELRIHGYELTLRLEEAEWIEIHDPFEKEEDSASGDLISDRNASGKNRNDAENAIRPHGYSLHPHIGEGGIYHDRNNEDPLPKGTPVRFALMGNQNCGKTTLFNTLTGSNQHVGNFPGVTVERKEGQIKNHKDASVVDLPGIYSLSPYTAEELVSRRFVVDEKPDGIINIVDATNLERNLYLTLQLMELNVPMVIAVNFIDEIRNNGGGIDINAMEAYLGIPVVPISAVTGEGIEELLSHAMHVAKYRERPGRQDFCSQDEHGGAIHRAIHAITHMIEDHGWAAGLPERFAATKLIEGDDEVRERLKLSQNEIETVEHIIRTMEEESGMDRNAAIADMRYDFIRDLSAHCVTKIQSSKERLRSERIDRILTGKWTAIPAFVLIMGLTFFLTFNVIGALLQKLLERGIDALTASVDAALVGAGVSQPLHSLMIDGIFSGVGSVVSFVPVIVVLFFFLSILEDSGYMARVAFVMDKLLRKLGLSGRSIVPMLIGFGCTVPAVMSSRTLPSDRDRKMTILLTPFMSCTAKLPVYGFFANAFFPQYAGWIMIGLYFLGILTGILIAFLMKKTIFQGEAVPFVMELPNYRMPTFKNVILLLWDKAKDFLEKAFTVILVATVVIWFLQSYSFGLNYVSGGEESILANLAGFIAPVFTLQGFADWRIVSSLIAGLVAKESVVSTLHVLFSDAAALHSVLSPHAAASLLVFCLLYTPCFAAIAAIRRELGRPWAYGIMLFQCLIAWLLSALAILVLGANVNGLLIVLISLAVIWGIYRIFQRRGHCSGCDGNCSGCSRR